MGFERVGRRAGLGNVVLFAVVTVSGCITSTNCESYCLDTNRVASDGGSARIATVSLASVGHQEHAWAGSTFPVRAHVLIAYSDVPTSVRVRVQPGSLPEGWSVSPSERWFNASQGGISSDFIFNVHVPLFTRDVFVQKFWVEADSSRGSPGGAVVTDHAEFAAAVTVDHTVRVVEYVLAPVLLLTGVFVFFTVVRPRLRERAAGARAGGASSKRERERAARERAKS